MDIKQLRYFIATAKYLNFTEAAKHLYLAQPALSRQIADLEDYLGTQLFIRDKRGLKLTAAGSELLMGAKEIVAKTEEVVRKVKFAASGLMGNLKIGYLGTSETKFLPKLIRTFNQKNPNIELSIVRYNWEDLTDALENGELDVAFSLNIGLENIIDLQWQKVYTEFLALVVPDDHPFAKEKNVNIKDLAKESFILISQHESPQLFNYILRLCNSNGFYPKIISQPQFFETVLLQVESGLGVSILSRHAKDFASPSLRFIDLDHNDISVDLAMIWKASNSNPCIPLFLVELKELMNL